MFPRAQDKLDLISFSKIRYGFLGKTLEYSRPGQVAQLFTFYFIQGENIFCFVLISCYNKLFIQFFFNKRNLWSFYQEFWKSNFPLIATNFCLLQVLIFAFRPSLSPAKLPENYSLAVLYFYVKLAGEEEEREDSWHGIFCFTTERARRLNFNLLSSDGALNGSFGSRRWLIGSHDSEEVKFANCIISCICIALQQINILDGWGPTRPSQSEYILAWPAATLPVNLGQDVANFRN